ncbi:MAG: hypothetical protein BM565_13615 [Gammaproteobacteria bacterium MedPE]|nr:MAG: hypothetical protein BM565_13615 [Gammaproteobacteria bacterium MedPE]
MSKVISKAQLVDVLTQWQLGQINVEKMQIWMIDNFEPDEFSIGKGESEHTVEAMHIVMNEYELVDESKCLTDGAQLAIDFVNSTSDTFMSTRGEFLRNGFKD